MIPSKLKMENLELLEQKYKTDLADLELLIARLSLLPHNCLPITVTRDGSRWVCMYECHPDPLRCVIAYGESPKQACENFDNLWNGTGYVLEEVEEEEEEF